MYLFKFNALTSTEILKKTFIIFNEKNIAEIIELLINLCYIFLDTMKV